MFHCIKSLHHCSAIFGEPLCRQTEPNPDCVGMQLSVLGGSSSGPSLGEAGDCGGHTVTPVEGVGQINHLLMTKKGFREK